MASNPSKRPSTKKFARTLKIPVDNKGTGQGTGTARASVEDCASAIEREHRRLTLADVWDESDAAFFQPYADRITGKAP